MSRSLILVAIAMIALAAAPAQAQITNPSFSSGFPIPSGWTVESGVGSSVFFGEAGMPTDPFFYLSVDSAGTGGAVPHSNPGGFGTDASNTAVVSQVFSTVDSSSTLLGFDCVFVSNNVAELDFLEVSISDGTSVYNVVRIDTTMLTGGESALMTPTVDLGAIFPTATESTLFELRLHVGDVGGGSPSKGLFDRFTLTAGTPFATNDVAFDDFGSSQRIKMETVLPSTRCWHFISGNTAGPVGGGEIFGLYADPLIFDILAFPVGTPGLHIITNVNGDYQTFVPTAAVASGSVFDYLIVVFDNGGNVSDITAAKRYVWP